MYKFFKRVYFFCIVLFRFPRGVIIEGDPRKIHLGSNVLLEPGSILNVKYGGSISVGNNFQLFRGAMLATYGGNIEIGNFCSVNPYTIIYGHGGVIIKNYVRIAAHSVIVPANHIFSNQSIPIHQQGLSTKGITIESDVWIGAGVKVLDGVIIHQGVVVAAGAVVNQSLPPFTVCGGVPCKVIKRR